LKKNLIGQLYDGAANMRRSLMAYKLKLKNKIYMLFIFGVGLIVWIWLWNKVLQVALKQLFLWTLGKSI